MIPAGEPLRSGPAPQADRSVGELFSELAAETSTLVRQEVQLAAREMQNKATYAGKQAAYIAVGVLLGVVSLLSFIWALVFGLATMIELWKSALVVGIVAAVVAALVVWKGLSALRQMSIVPRQTILTLREDKQWLQHQVSG